MPRVFAAIFWLWSAFVAVAAGFLGTILNCEGGDGCKPGSPSWLRPWTWGEYYVYPNATLLGLAAVVVATAFVYFAFVNLRAAAAFALVVSVGLLSYPYFGGMTAQGRAIFWFGLPFGLAAVASLRRDIANPS